MATKNASGNQGQVKDPEHDGRLKGHKGGEAPKAHAEGTHPDEKDAKHDEKPEPAKAETKAEAKSEPAKADTKADPSEDADLKSREYTDAEGNVHHHTKKYMETHKG